MYTKCKEVTFPLSHEIKECIQDMKKIMLNNDSFWRGTTLGMSANQIGNDYSIMYVSRYPGNRKLRYSQFDVLINAKIDNLSHDTSIYWEGCVSDDK